MLKKKDLAVHLDSGKIYRGQIVGREDLKSLGHSTADESYIERVQSSGLCVSNSYFTPMNKVKSRGGNYFHFLFHEMQRFISYRKDKEVLTLIDDMNDFQKKIIDLFFNLNNVNLIKPTKYTSVDFKNIRVGVYEDINSISNRLLDFYEEHISSHRKDVNIDFEKIFIRRRNSKATARPDNVFTNVEEIENIYIDKGFKTVYFEDLETVDKISLLNSSINEIVTPIGSELANLLFMSKTKKVDITIIDHDNWRFRKESRMGSIVTPKSEKISVLTANCVEMNKDNLQNSSFKLDPKKVY